MPRMITFVPLLLALMTLVVFGETRTCFSQSVTLSLPAWAYGPVAVRKHCLALRRVA